MMREFITGALVFACLIVAGSAEAATGKIIKVLPHLLDREGKHALSPSLYDRDAYQAHLRKYPEERSGIRFDIQWKAALAGSATQLKLKLKLEMRGMKDSKAQDRTLELAIDKNASFARWSSLALKGEDYKQFGEMSAWRVTLWNSGQLLGSQQSFLWQSDEDSATVTARSAKKN